MRFSVQLWETTLTFSVTKGCELDLDAGNRPGVCVLLMVFHGSIDPTRNYQDIQLVSGEEKSFREE